MLRLIVDAWCCIGETGASAGMAAIYADRLETLRDALPLLSADGVVPLQPAFLLQPRLYLGDALFAGVKRSWARVHRVVSEGEFIRMAYCRAENEFGVGFGMEVDRLIRCLKGHQLARLDRLRNCKPS